MPEPTKIWLFQPGFKRNSFVLRSALIRSIPEFHQFILKAPLRFFVFLSQL